MEKITIEEKCKVCEKKWEWIYRSDLYCNEHLPCGKFKRFIGRVITLILSLRLKTY